MKSKFMVISSLYPKNERQKMEKNEVIKNFIERISMEKIAHLKYLQSENEVNEFIEFFLETLNESITENLEEFAGEDFLKEA